MKMVWPLVRLRDLLNLWGLREVALFYFVNLRQNTWSTNEKFDGCVTNKSEMDDTASNRPLDNDSKEMLFFPANVQAAISEVFSTDDFDPLDAPEFSAIGT